MNWLIGLAVIVGSIATAEDLWRRRISNRLTAFALCAGLCVRSTLYGFDGALAALLGALLGTGIFLLFFLKGAMGGGDIKLMGAFGAIVGDGQIVLAAVIAAILGAVLALGRLCLAAAESRLNSSNDREANPPWRRMTIPYAPAITLGAWLSFVPHLPGIN